MQKIKALSSILLLGFCLLSAQEVEEQTRDERGHRETSFALSSGFAVRNEGEGPLFDLTADLCYQPWQYAGIGSKFSYWRGGSLFGVFTELPFTVYGRVMKDFKSLSTQIYASVGGGFATLINPLLSTSYKVSAYKVSAEFITEIEFGLKGKASESVSTLYAIRLVFPVNRYSRCGGLDLRAGLAFDF